MGKIIAYPGTFDPLTIGHESVINRATKIFDEVIVVVARGVHKAPLFTLEERTAMITNAVKKLPNVSVLPLSGLLADLLSERKINLVLRGLRTVADYEHEIQLADINHRLNNSVETLFIAPNTEFIHVASHFVREIAMLGGDVGHYVNPTIKEVLVKKYLQEKAS